MAVWHTVKVAIDPNDMFCSTPMQGYVPNCRHSSLIQDGVICSHVYRLSPWLCGPCDPTGPPISRAPKKNSPAGRGIFVYEASSGPVHASVSARQAYVPVNPARDYSVAASPDDARVLSSWLHQIPQFEIVSWKFGSKHMTNSLNANGFFPRSRKRLARCIKSEKTFFHEGPVLKDIALKHRPDPKLACYTSVLLAAIIFQGLLLQLAPRAPRGA
jgi:hypothetical protein